VDDDDYHYNEERKSQRWRVIFGIGGALAALALLVMRYGNWRDREAAMRTPMPAYFEPSIPGPRTDFSVAREPIEFQLVVGDKRLDVIPGQRIELPRGGSIVLEQTPLWQTVGAGYHFQHRSSVSISPNAEMLIASIDGVVAKMQVMDAKMSDADAKKLLSSSIVDTGQTIGAPAPVQRTIAGKPRDGLLHDTTTNMKVEIFLVPVGKQKLGVLLYRQDPNADTAKLDGLLETIAAGPGTPLPEFTAPIASNLASLFLGKPQRLALDPPVTVTLEHRPTVLRTMTSNGGSLTFEHPRGLAVARMPDDQMLAVMIQNDTTVLQLFDLDMKLTVAEVQRALVGHAAKDLGEIRRSHGGRSLQGRKFRMEMENVTVEYEVYILDRGGKTIGAGIQYVATDEQRAIELALPILASVR
jgi:hypothetical protein